MIRHSRDPAPEPGPLIRRFFTLLARLAGRRPDILPAPETKARISRLDRSLPPRPRQRERA